MSEFNFSVANYQAEQEDKGRVVQKMPWEVEVEHVDARANTRLAELGVELPVAEPPPEEPPVEASVVENPSLEEPVADAPKKKRGRPAIKKHVNVSTEYREAYAKYIADCALRKDMIAGAQEAVRQALADRKVAVDQWAQHIATLRLKVAEAKAAPTLLPPRREDY